MNFARTKIQPPRPRATFVERGRVQARLAEALVSCKVALLCAPAGYGKTAVLAQEVSRLPADTAVAWVSADTGDDLQRLLECMLTALEPFDPPWRTAPEALVARVDGSDALQRTVAGELINTLDACDAPRGLIAFDDVHRVHDAAFFRFLDVLIERLSPRWCIALTSRVDPPLALARLRARDEIAEFRQLQLQFARDEARRLAAGSGLDTEAADRLFDRTQGWPAGMRIAIGALQAGGRPVAGRQATGAPERALAAAERPMFEYLVAEVLDQLRPELATFLERVSVLPELETSRCGAVAAAPNAALLLDEVERVGLCFDVLDAPVRTLRLHDLLRDALQRRLEIGQPQRLAELRQLAAATEPDALRRIGLLLDAGDPGAAAQAVFEHGPPTVPLGLSSSLMHLVGRFPAAFREKSPELHFVRGLVGWEHWDFAAMLSHMERAEAGFADAGDPERERLARAYRSCALIARGRVNEAAPLLEALSSARLSPVARIVMLNGLSWLRMETGRIRGVAPLITEMVALLEQVDRLDLWFQTTPPTRVPGMPGMTPTLMRHAEQLLRVAGDRPTPLRALATLVQAWNPFWRGDIAEAVRLREIARADAEWTGASAAVQGHLLTLTALGHAVRGDHATAISIATARVRNHQAGYGSYGRYVVLQAAARIATICGDAAALRGFVQQMAVAQAALGAAEAPERIRPQGPTIAQLAWLEGRADEAIGLWQDALRHEEEIDILCQAAETRVRLARALVRRGDIDQAAVTLAPVFERALEQGGPGGALLATDALRELAAAPWGAALADEQQATLRRWWQLLADDRSTYSGGSATHEPPESPQTQPRGAAVAGLTARETEVLARIAAGDSNKLIARQFDLSLHTVKRHVANILGKLGVATRGQAAAWYRQPGDASTRVLRG